MYYVETQLKEIGIKNM